MATRTVKPITEDGWTHAGGAIRWRVTEEGIVTESNDAMTSVRQPRLRQAKVNTDLAAKVVAQYGEIIEPHATAYQLDPRLVVATIVCESAGDPKAQRYEKHLGDYSIGLGQTLTATAYAIARMSGVRTRSQVKQTIFPASAEVLRFAVPDKSVPQGGSLEEWRDYLGEPWTSIQLMAALHAYNRDKYATSDVVTLAACYNAGSPRRSTNAWGLVHAASYLDAVSGHMFWASKAWREREAAA